ncbi:MAG: hypothetical protein ACTSXO_02595 [Candidatus Heimdallarchaeota archaeon]
MNKKDDHAAAMLVQKHQLSSAEDQVSKIDSALDTLIMSQAENDACLDAMLNDMEARLEQNNISFDENSVNTTSDAFKELESSIQVSDDELQLCTPKLDTIETIDFDSKMSWSEYMSCVEEYAFKHNVDLTSDPYQQLMSTTQRIELEKRIKEEFTIVIIKKLGANVSLQRATQSLGVCC